ncbi:B22R family protein [Penguinpox virus]|uniref:B22R family protein n=1 Tax=Penguinpox virus TaxID=648998 RepID=A0A068ELJ9_9POXV|nr:B22R family protein [Penguinpox virus]AID46837.1 B22R family protein [Penguinpox virus]
MYYYYNHIAINNMKNIIFISVVLLFSLVYSDYDEYEDEYENTCLRKQAKYHSLSKTISPKELSDHKASATIKYLSSVRKKEEQRFIDCFNWTNIQQTIKSRFVKECELSTDKDHSRFQYNYTYVLDVSIYAPKKPKRGDNTSARRKVTSCIVASALSLSKEDVQYLICKTAGSELTCSLPSVSTITYTGTKCRNITVDKVTVGNYSVLTDNNNENAHTDIFITFDGISSSPPYESSDIFEECITEMIKTCEDYNDQHDKVKVKKILTGHCNDCSMGLMAEVTEVPKEFNISLKECGGMGYSDLVNLFYLCEVTGGDNCINYIPLTDKIKDSSFKVLSAYTGSGRKKRKSRPRRNIDDSDIDEINIGDDNLECMYLYYDNDNDNDDRYDYCIKNPNKNKKHKKRKISRKHHDINKLPKQSYKTRPKRSLDEHKMKNLKEYFGLEGVIPPKASYIQVGISSSEGSILGDGNIISTLKDSMRSKLEKMITLVPVDTPPKSLMSTISKSINSDGDFTSGLISSISYQKQQSIKEALTQSFTSIEEELDDIKRRLGHLELREKQLEDKLKQKNLKTRKVVEHYKDSIDKYGKSGGSRVSSSVIHKNPVVGVNVGSVITKPGKTISFPEQPIHPNNRHSNLPLSLPSSVYYNTNTRSGTSASRRCKRGLTSAMCGLLMLTPLPRTRRPVPAVQSDSSSSDSLLSVAPVGNFVLDSSSSSLISSVDLTSYWLSSSDAASGINVGAGPSGQRLSFRDDSSFRVSSSSVTSSSSIINRRRSSSSGISSGGYSSSGISSGGYSSSGSNHVSDYGSRMNRISRSFDKTLALGLAAQFITQGLMDRNLRSFIVQDDDRDEAEVVFDVVSTAIGTIGSIVTASGIIASPQVAFAGMGLSAISGLLDAGRDIYYILSGKQRPQDPVLKTFNAYRDYVTDTSKSGVRKCMMPGTETIVYMSYRNDSSVIPSLEKLSLFFVDSIDSVLYYLNTSNVILDFSLTVACPIGYLRSPTLDINAYTVLKFTSEEGARFYTFTRLGAMLSKFPVVRLTCGKDITLTLKPFEIALNEMQLLKMSTPGEPEETKSIPSNVCDIFPLKRFYLTVRGCPFDNSMVSVVHTTCSVLLRMATWEPLYQRWVLENPFEQNGRLRQLFTFQKYDFNETVIKPNEIPGHSKFCTNRHATECYWTELMVLDDTSPSCASRARTIYLELYTFGNGRGFTSLVLTCPSGSTPVAVGDKEGIIELPLADFYTVKMFASKNEKKIGVFCVDNYNSDLKSDLININFVSQIHQEGIIYLDEYIGKEKVFEDVSKLGNMPWRSRRCVTWQHKRQCVSFHGKIDVWTEDYNLETDVGPELMITEKYEPSTITLQNINKSATLFPYELKVEFYVGNLGNAYSKPERFWDDATRSFRTYSSIVLALIPCTMRANMLMYNISDFISVMAYHQSMTYDYGDGSKYTFYRIAGSECIAYLDLKSKMISVRCEPFSIPRTINEYEGMCFITVTSRDHCATEVDDIKNSGYTKEQADKPRYCDIYINPAVWEDAGHYCGYFSQLRHIGYRHPDYEACKSYINIHYKDVWIENEVLLKPPYAFEFKYDKNNEYVDPKLSDSLKRLYDEYKSISQYTNSSLPESINRLSSSLTSEGRSITDVSIDGGILETAFEANVERLIELEEQITDTAHMVLANTLSGDDLQDIYSDKETCCKIDFSDNTVSKTMEAGNYSCGTLDDYLYDDFVEYDDPSDDEDRVLILINGTLEDFDVLKHISKPVITCIDPIVIPLEDDDVKEEVEETILLQAFKEGIEEIMHELDLNISSILLKNNITTINIE